MKNTRTVIAGLVTALLVTTTPAHAYLDPGTGSMLLQGLIAAVAGVMVTARMYWHKIKGFFGRGAEPKAHEKDDRDHG